MSDRLLLLAAPLHSLQDQVKGERAKGKNQDPYFTFAFSPLTFNVPQKRSDPPNREGRRNLFTFTFFTNGTFTHKLKKGEIPMDLQNLMPNQAQPITRITSGQLPAALTELTEEVLGEQSDSSILPASAILGWSNGCSYDGDDAD